MDSTRVCPKCNRQYNLMVDTVMMSIDGDKCESSCLSCKCVLVPTTIDEPMGVFSKAIKQINKNLEEHKKVELRKSVLKFLDYKEDGYKPKRRENG
jgi:hypothetical protein